MKNYIIYTLDGKTLQWGKKSIDSLPSDFILEIHENHEDCAYHFHKFNRIYKEALRCVEMAPDELKDALRALMPPLQRPLLETAREYRRAQEAIFCSVPPKREKAGRKAVICAETKSAWPTQAAAADATGVTRTAMNAHLKMRKGYDTLRGLQFTIIPNYTGEFGEQYHAAKINEWLRRRKEKKRLSDPVAAIAAVHQKEAARNEVKRTAERWVPPEDGKE